MSIQLRALRARPGITPRDVPTQGSDHLPARGRLLQAILAVYLIPVLLVVLVVGGIGLLLLTLGQAVGWIARSPASPNSSSS
jgi:hypothetical protein